MRFRGIVLTFFLATAVVAQYSDAESHHDDPDEDPIKTTKSRWIVETRDGTQYIDVEELCGKKLRISARDGSPVNELVEHGFDLVEGRKGNVYDLDDNSVSLFCKFPYF